MIDALLRHLELDERPAADAAGLAVVHRRFLERVSYDGLTAQLGEHTPLEADRLVERLLATGRGGYCFEINTVLAALLEGLGFEVERREGVVDAREAFAGGAPTNHQALVVRAAGEAFICDAGWGEGFLEPLALAPGTSSRGSLEWVVERTQDGGWWVQQHMWGSTPGFRFGDEVVATSVYEPHHVRLATTPDSSFVQTLVVQKPLDDRIVTLRARTLSEKGPDVDVKRVLDEEAFAQALTETFNINLDAARVARLWNNARAQHDAFTRSASSPGSAGPSPAPPASA
ncbi:arylamine N-acetyltransferase family protein [Baekduia sp. Peel2402]|uniref:arylamine N-acetyltransferase family protein n=1 Tax=Baekduia sp. Peel2402 TaxID=3458296 RepID=UPI00403E822A